MKLEIEITEEEIKNAIERKVRVAIADQTNNWNLDNLIRQKVKELIPITIDSILAETLADTTKIKKKILESVEKEIKRKVQVALKIKGE